MITILSVFGTRPEAIKMAPLVKAFDQYPERIRSVTCATGQHREMLAQVMGLFDIAADHDLDVMLPNQTLAQLTARLLTGLDAVIETVQPDWILAVGDTATVFVSALAAYYRRISFGHVEAGLRTGDKYNPFPEEINRRVADFIADAYFAPTDRARVSLVAEGYPEAAVYVTGNTVVDALLEVAAQPYDWSAGPLAGVADSDRVVLVTADRR